MNNAVTSLIYKDNGKAKDSLENYRPITVCSVLYKILSRTVASAMLAEIHYVIDPNQSAFQMYKETGHTPPISRSVSRNTASNSTPRVSFCSQTNPKRTTEYATHSSIKS